MRSLLWNAYRNLAGVQVEIVRGLAIYIYTIAWMNNSIRYEPHRRMKRGIVNVDLHWAPRKARTLDRAPSSLICGVKGLSFLYIYKKRTLCGNIRIAFVCHTAACGMGVTRVALAGRKSRDDAWLWEECVGINACALCVYACCVNKLCVCGGGGRRKGTTRIALGKVSGVPD